MSNVSTRIDKARWWVVTNQPFYGGLMMRLRDAIKPSIATAHTNGREIGWNPTFVETLDDEELRFVLLHETLHCAHQHMWRLPADEHGNIAGDHAINLILNKIKGIRMPEGGLADPQYEGMAEEDIYRALGENQPPPSQSEPDEQDEDGDDDEDGDQDNGGADEDGDEDDGGSDAGGEDGDEDGGSESQGGASQPGDQPQQGGKPDPCGSFGEPATDPDSEGDPAAESQESQDLRDEWEGAVMQAAQTAQALGAGDIPADMQRLLDKVRHQSIDWQGETSEFVKQAVSERNDWSRSSRRHAWQPVIYPRRREDELGKVVFVRDTSGSVSEKQLADYSAIISQCIAETGCEGLLIDCDATIQAEYELDAETECPLYAKGGGGTDLRPPFTRAEEMVDMGEDIAGIVYITDLDAGWRIPAESAIPTLWLSTTDRVGPFGRTVRIES